MITNREISDIREFMEESNNPVFLFDDDCDGTCSYLLLKKFYKKGEGIIVKSSPSLDERHLGLISDKKPDLLVILDKPVVKQEFIDKIKTKIVWIDHHPVQKMKNVNYYNPRNNDSSDNRPTTYMAYSVTKSDLWIATIGCVFDHYIPDFIEEFIKEYPDLLDRKPRDPGEALYTKRLGKLVRIFSLNLKGKAKDVRKSIKALEKIDSPYDILDRRTEYGTMLFSRYEKLNKEYECLLEEAKNKVTHEKLFIFIYPSAATSFTSELCNELTYLYPDKFIIVGRKKDGEIRMSLRSKRINISDVLKKALVGIKGYGGGHDYACGGAVKEEDFERFIENIKELIK